MMFPLRLINDLSLDFFAEQDAPQLYQLIQGNRAYLKEFLPWLDYSNSIEDSLIFIRKTTQENQTQKSLTLCIREANKINGVICFHEIDHDKNCAGIGYWLASSAQGKGYMTIACEALINYGFKELQLDRITLSCGTTNYKSIAIAERLNFPRREIYHDKEWLYDHFVDHYCYELTADEWASMQQTCTTSCIP